VYAADVDPARGYPHPLLRQAPFPIIGQAYPDSFSRYEKMQSAGAAPAPGFPDHLLRVAPSLFGHDCVDAVGTAPTKVSLEDLESSAFSYRPSIQALRKLG
jgi:hypothetical protein